MNNVNNTEEKVVAVIEAQPDQPSAGENELNVSVRNMQTMSCELVVENDEQFEQAGEMGRLIKTKIGEVTDFFAPMKKAAHDAHKNICEREKAMLQPLKDAEASLKKVMGDYAQRKEAERIALEEKARKEAEAEMEEKIAEAIEAEENGDIDAAQSAMLDAEMAESIANSSSIVGSTPTKVSGVSQSKDYEITGIDLTKVPCEINGIVIRPVDEKAVLRLIKASKGSIKIDGITYKETIKTSFRRNS